MAYKFTVFDDPSMSNDTAAALSQIADDTGCTVTSGVVEGTHTQILRAWNLCQVFGLPVSVVRYES
jgi:hypothetical protein